MALSVSSGGTVHIVQRMEPGGIQTLILDMVRASKNERDRIFSLELDNEELIADWPLLADFEDRLVAFERGEGLLPSLVKQLAAALRKCKPETVIVHHIGPLLYGGAAARLARVPHLIHVEHDVWHYDEKKDRIIAALSFRLFRPHNVAVSHEVAQGLRDIVGQRPIAVIPPAIDESCFLPAPRDKARDYLDLPTDVTLVGSAGRLVEVKAYDLLIDAIALLPKNFHLALAGDGPLRADLEKRADEQGVRERVHFLGLRSDLDKVIPALDMFCLSSHNEGLPRVVLEAQACDIPVVATDVGAMKDAVCPTSGRLVAAGDAAALAKGLREQSEAKVKEGETRAFVVEKYGLQKMLDAYARVVES